MRLHERREYVTQGVTVYLSTSDAVRYLSQKRGWVLIQAMVIGSCLEFRSAITRDPWLAQAQPSPAQTAFPQMKRPSTLKSCGWDLGCFAEASNQSQPVEGQIISGWIFFAGIVPIDTFHIEVWGKNHDNCGVMYRKIAGKVFEDTTVNPTVKTDFQAIQPLTPEEIQQRLGGEDPSDWLNRMDRLEIDPTSTYCLFDNSQNISRFLSVMSGNQSGTWGKRDKGSLLLLNSQVVADCLIE